MKFSVIINLMLASVLLTSMFLIGITTSEYSTTDFPPDPSGGYSPWGDLNDDGSIDLYDCVWLLTRYGSKGTSVNKTALLYEYWDTYLTVLSKLDSLNATIIEQQNIINYLNETVIYLNETVAILNSTGLGAPDYDSGWQSLSSGQQLYLMHNLNTTELIVYLVGRYESGDMWLHQYSFGSQLAQHGAWWAASNTTIIVYRAMHDYTSFQPWNYVRIMIWEIPQP